MKYLRDFYHHLVYNNVNMKNEPEGFSYKYNIITISTINKGRLI